MEESYWSENIDNLSREGGEGGAPHLLHAAAADGRVKKGKKRFQNRYSQAATDAREKKKIKIAAETPPPTDELKKGKKCLKIAIATPPAILVP